MESQQQSPAAQCRTLADYRIKVLGLKQRDIADRAKCFQSWISQIERGQLPKPWSRSAVLRAYSLERWEEDFVRMVTAARISQAITKPMSETEPLLALGQSPETAPIIGLEEQMTRIARGEVSADELIRKARGA